MGVDSVEIREREVVRVAQHIRRAERAAARRQLGRLRPFQRVVRALLLRELAHYREAARFPQNRDFLEPMPYFVDGAGNRCAVAHLLELGGEARLVQRIAREQNHARVRELATEPRLVAWLDAAGLSLDEAALIQPTYCFVDRSCICDRQTKTYFEVVTIADPVEGMVAARVTAIHGAPLAEGVELGDELQVELDTDAPVPVSTELVLWGASTRNLPDGSAVYEGVSFPFLCADSPLDKRQYLQAVLSCVCEGKTGSPDTEADPDGDAGCGCRSAGASSGEPSSFGILLSLLGVVVARRMRRSRPTISRRLPP